MSQFVRRIFQDRSGNLWFGTNSDGVIRTLTLRGLIEDAGQDPESQAHLYRTTGYFLERLGLRDLDELPELWNVLRGEMSLVGPRPLLMQYLDRYTPEQARRHAVRPGITGLAQVSGRNALSWDDKFALDVQYVETVSLSLDLKILFLTVFALFSQRGAY